MRLLTDLYLTLAIFLIGIDQGSGIDQSRDGLPGSQGMLKQGGTGLPGGSFVMHPDRLQHFLGPDPSPSSSSAAFRA